MRYRSENQGERRKVNTTTKLYYTGKRNHAFTPTSLASVSCFFFLLLHSQLSGLGFVLPIPPRSLESRTLYYGRFTSYSLRIDTSRSELILLARAGSARFKTWPGRS